jgi:hypothetical protein
VGVGKLRGADTVSVHEGGDAGEGFGEAVGIAEAGIEKAGLADERARGGDAELDGGDGGGGLERLEVGVERAEENI